LEGEKDTFEVGMIYRYTEVGRIERYTEVETIDR